MAAEYAVCPQVVLRCEGFGGLAFDRRSWALHRVNQTGYAILKLLSTQVASRARIHQFVDSAYGETDAAQRHSVDVFLDRLLALGIIEEDSNTERGLEQSNPESLDHAVRVSSLQRTARYLSAPTFVWWDITAACNLKCKQCYSSSGARLPAELTTDEVRDILRQLAHMKVFYVYFLGGEPFLRKDFFTILRYCRSLGIEVMISTNGWYITEELARNLVRLGVRHVRVSIDGATAATHDAIRGVESSFHRAVQAVTTLKVAGLPVVGITPTIMGENVAEAEMLVDLAHDLDVDEIQLVQVCAVGRGRKISSLDASDVLNLKGIIARKSAQFGAEISITGSEGIWEKPLARCVMEERIFPEIMGCGAGRTCLALSPNGQARACLLFQYTVGNLRDQGFQEIWMGKDSPEIQWLRSIKEGCDGCKYASVCSGPCPMQEIISAEQRECFVRLEQSKGE